MNVRTYINIFIHINTLSHQPKNIWEDQDFNKWMSPFLSTLGKWIRAFGGREGLYANWIPCKFHTRMCQWKKRRKVKRSREGEEGIGQRETPLPGQDSQLSQYNNILNIHTASAGETSFMWWFQNSIWGTAPEQQLSNLTCLGVNLGQRESG